CAKEGGSLLFAQKGGWTRYGVYVVHISILIILLGAVIGSPTVAKKIFKNPQFAFKGGVLLPELRSTERIFPMMTKVKFPLVSRCAVIFLTFIFMITGCLRILSLA
ncbi:cytochrome c biogenesis protein ResB, partial [Desulfobulbus sp. F1]|nr:cytochrome c biogenesis protein ResB [Desulfobulbus sp. F1]